MIKLRTSTPMLIVLFVAMPPLMSVTFSQVVRPNSAFPLCQATDLVLGQLNGGVTFDPETETYGYTGTVRFAFNCTNSTAGSNCRVCRRVVVSHDGGTDTHDYFLYPSDRSSLNCGSSNEITSTVITTGLSPSSSTTYQVAYSIAAFQELSCEDGYAAYSLTAFDQFSVAVP